MSKLWAFCKLRRGERSDRSKQRSGLDEPDELGDKFGLEIRCEDSENCLEHVAETAYVV